MSSPPPPPPPHGEAPKTTAGGGLPNGKYDVFIIPEHSAGSGFLYLPSLRTNTNSFIAGFASALVVVVIFQSMAPAFQAWWANFQGMGNMGMLLLVIGVGLGAWSLGRQSSDSSGRGEGTEGGFYSGGGPMPGGGGFSSTGSSAHAGQQGPAPNAGPPPYANSPPPPPGGSQPSADRPNGSYQRPPPQPQPQAYQAPPPPEPEPKAQPPPEPKPEPKPQPPPPPQPKPQPPPPPQPQPSTAKPQAEPPKNSWEKAREEVRRQAEERKVKEAEEKRRAEAAARLKELREKEARERAQREAEKMRKEAEAKAQAEKLAKEARAKELRERLVREREERRKKLEEEKKRKEEEANQARKTSSYAYSGVGEKTNPWPSGKPPTVSPQAGNPPTPTPAAAPASPTKKPPAPTARSFAGTEEESYSYRPYDQPKRPGRRMSNSDMSESSWAPSQSTARTTPPPSVRGTYSTKDPDKIVIKAVYCFMNQFAKTPASQLLSGVGSVTDGLILRITTEGLFIDDDVRGVAQREWDVKAWTLKGVEVWCPVHFLACAIAANSPPSPPGSKSPASSSAAPNNLSTAFFARTMGGNARLRAAERGAPKTLTGDDADTYLTEMLASCKDSCRLGDCASAFSVHDDASSVASGSTRNTDSTAQTGDWKAKGLHLLRATIRDQEGKRYMFVIGEEEGWKVAVGLQRLRKGSQVRALGVAGLGGLETKNTLEMLGWG